MKTRGPTVWLLPAALALVAGAAWFISARPRPDVAERAENEPSPPPRAPTATDADTPAPAEFAGSESCTDCHAAEAKLYAGSHHQQALRLATPDIVAAPFGSSTQQGRSFESKLGGPNHFSREAMESRVEAPDARGHAATWPIVYIAGIAPLEQYIVDAGKGRLQSYGVAFQMVPDRGAPNAARWFHVYGEAGIAPGDPRYFTAPAQNWNHVCADCHSTNVKRHYDAEQRTYESEWTDLNVGCEACHGPGSNHIARTKAGQTGGLTVNLPPSTPWLPAANGSPEHHAVDEAQVETCAPCHSRRETLREGHHAGDPLLDFFEPELLRAGRYEADGQVQGEVYEWGSFLQSKMHASGVRCSDCHEPHSGKPRADGDSLCTSCHTRDRFATSAHSHHEAAQASCVDCHMPSHTFMEVDARRDHSLRIPRPEWTASYGIPNACNACHTDKTASWAAQAQNSWSPNSEKPRHYAEAFWLERNGRRGARDALLAVAQGAAFPAIARATALELLGQHPGPRTVEALRKGLTSPDALVALGAAQGAARLEPTERLTLLIPALSHPRRAVRIVIGKALADAPLTELSPEARQALLGVWREVEESFDVAATLPSTEVERAAFALRRGAPENAKAALKRALTLEPCSVEAWVNLAELARRSNDSRAVDEALKRALNCEPSSASAHYSRGLELTRRRELPTAERELALAVKAAPENPRMNQALAAVYAETNQLGRAIAVLERGLERRQEDQGLLGALIDYSRRQSDLGRAKNAEEQLTELRSE